MILWKALLAGVASATALGTGFTLATLRTELPKQPDIVQVGITAGGQSAEAMRPWRQPVMPSQDNEGIGTAAASPSGTDSRGARGDDSPDDVRDSVDGHDDHDDASEDEAHHDDASEDEAHHDDHGADQDDHEDDDHGDDGGDD